MGGRCPDLCCSVFKRDDKYDQDFLNGNSIEKKKSIQKMNSKDLSKLIEYMKNKEPSLLTI